MTTLLLLAPQTPMLFMGQEFASSAPFLNFADHNPELAKLVMKGRFEFLKQFRTIACSECESVCDNPESEATFRRCILDFSEREKNRDIHTLHRDLLKLRRSDPVFRKPRLGGVDGAVLGPEALVLRFFDDVSSDELHESPAVSRPSSSEEEHRDSQSSSLQQPGDRLLVLNLGADLRLPSIAEPLLAPPCDCKWKPIFSTEQICYGGSGAPPVEDEEGKWWLAAHAATVLSPIPLEECRPQ
jgi:maltooligosyltrehalose trehalohydrolase